MRRQNLALGMMLAVVLGAVGWGTAQADVIVQQPNTDYLVVEAEAYEFLEGPEDTGFLLVGTDDPFETDLLGSLVLPEDTNASEGQALYDQPGGGNLNASATWELQFAAEGLYTLYARYTLFDYQMADDGVSFTYGNEDSFFLPLDLDDVAEQAGRFDVSTQGHGDPLEDPPYWEGYFHWTEGPATLEDGSPAEYVVRGQDVGQVLDFNVATRERGSTLDVMVFSLDSALTPDDLDELIGAQVPGDALQAGDADQDLDFDQIDLVKVQIAAKYLTGEAATWGDGDWNAAPGGTPGSPPPGNGFFDQLDIIAALANGLYLTGPYAAIQAGGGIGDDQTSVVYNTDTGELAVDAPAGIELTSINIDSTAGIFTGDPAENLGGSFDNDVNDNIFKATFGGSFASLSFGNVAQTGLSEDFVANDLTVVGSLQGGGGLGDVDLVFVPEPSTIVMLAMAMMVLAGFGRRRNPRQ